MVGANSGDDSMFFLSAMDFHVKIRLNIRETLNFYVLCVSFSRGENNLTRIETKCVPSPSLGACSITAAKQTALEYIQ